MSRRRFMGEKKLVLFQQRFFPAGTYTFTAPKGCTSVDVFCVGGGGGGGNGTGGGGGYTKTYKAIAVTPGEKITVVVGEGSYYPSRGGTSYFKTSSYSAYGGYSGADNGRGGDGGSGGGGIYPTSQPSGGSNGSSGVSGNTQGGLGQGVTTRDFGESSGKRNAGGGAGETSDISYGGSSDYTEGSGLEGNSYGSTKRYGGGGYGGGGGAARGGSARGGKGGDGTVLIRYYAYEQ